MPEPADQIILDLPRDPRLIGVARLVVGGLGARLDLPFEALDDLQLAVETILSAESATATPPGAPGHVRILARVAESSIGVELSPIASELDTSTVGGPSAGLTLEQVCSSLVDRHSVVEEFGERRLHLEKTIPTPAAS